MRGFFSFILLFFMAYLILVSLGSYSDVRGAGSAGDVLSLEAKYYLEIDYKRALLSAAALEARKADAEYEAGCTLAEAAAKLPADICKAGRERYVVARVGARFAEFERYVGGGGGAWEAGAWCGKMSDVEEGELVSKMLAEGKVGMCEGCGGISSAACLNALRYDERERELVLGRNGEVFGFSFYNKARRLAAVAHIPKSKARVKA